jgi:hypothetical protein
MNHRFNVQSNVPSMNATINFNGIGFMGRFGMNGGTGWHSGNVATSKHPSLGWRTQRSVGVSLPPPADLVSSPRRGPLPLEARPTDVR